MEPLAQHVLQGLKNYALPLSATYLVLCWTLRFRRERSMRARFGYDTRESLKTMTAHDAQQIIRELLVLEFPFSMYESLEFGLFKTYGVETISRLLLATKNLTDPEASLKRFEDTAVIIGEFMNYPPDSPRASAAIARMNWLHKKYLDAGQISNNDMLYTLSVFVVEPERFIRLFEWRKLNDMEKCALGVFWKSIGDAMGINYEGYLSKAQWEDGLDFFHDIQRWAKAYEIIAFKPNNVSAKPAEALIPMLTYWVPKSMKPFVTECVLVLLGDRVRDAFLLPEPGVTAAAVVYLGLSLRRFFLRFFSLPRYLPAIRHKEGQDVDLTKEPVCLNFSYGNFPFYIKPTFWNRWGPRAWVIWMLGGKLPGDDAEYFVSKGYTVAELGPRRFMGQGSAEVEAEARRLRNSGRSGCPFG